MKSREICVWLDERWYDALSRHLKDETVEDSLKYVRLGAAKHDFEVLLISSWNRLGRDLSETLDTMTELKNQNIAVQSVKEKNLSLDRVLSIARFAAAMQSPNETLPEELDETPFEDQEESEGFDMTQSF